METDSLSLPAGARVLTNPFRLIVGAVNDYAIFLLDPAGTIVSWNTGAERIKGYRPEEIIGRHFSSFYAPEEFAADKPRQELRTAVADGRYEEEGVRVRKDGSHFWASVTITAIFDDAGTHLGFVKVTRDITERKMAEATLRESEERFRSLVDGIKDYAIFSLDPAGNIVTWNSGSERLIGYSKQEIVGQNYARYFTPEDVATGKPSQELALAAATGRFDEKGWRVRKDGSRFWANGVLVALYDNASRVRGFAKVTRDLTEQHRSEGLLRSVLDNTLDSIICIDEHGIVHSFNRAAEKEFGYSQAEVVGQSVHVLMPDLDRDRRDGGAEALARTGIARVVGTSRELTACRKDGSTFPAELRITKFESEDGHRRFIGILRNTSEKKELEAQFQQAQKMEAFGQLAGGVAHDFNNLLTLISGYSDMLLNRFTLDAPDRELVYEIHKAGSRAAALTRQLLAFSRKQVLEPRVLDLNGIVMDMERMLHRLIGEDVRFATALDPNLPPVKVDAGQMEQVILNLVVNARDAMPQGGTLTIRTETTDLSGPRPGAAPGVPPGRYVALTVSDTGVGMTEEVRSRIFEPFFTTKEVGKGTGLGLAMVYGIVQQSGGLIEVSTELRRGTSFTIYLPVVHENAESAPGGSALRFPPPRGAETILVAEDEDKVRSFIRVSLQAQGYTVLVAARGAEAIRLSGSHAGPIHLLVTDVVMPEMSGRELATRLTALRPDLKVLYVSGYTDDAVVRHGVQQAETHFMQKPFTQNKLAVKIRQVLDGQ